MTSDAELQKVVLEELQWDPAVSRAEIGVMAKDGVATLFGDVRTFAEKFAAIRAARRVKGVRAVADDLKVKPGGLSDPSDTELAHKVVSSLSWNTLVPASITARVTEGWVTLEGTVDWEYQRAAATRTLRELEGVRGISNLVTLLPRVTGRDVAKRIKAAMHRSVELDAQGIHVEASGGKITLNGSVRLWSERAEAERAAWAAPGVTAIDNQITIQA